MRRLNWRRMPCVATAFWVSTVSAGLWPEREVSFERVRTFVMGAFRGSQGRGGGVADRQFEIAAGGGKPVAAQRRGVPAARGDDDADRARRGSAPTVLQ